MRARPRWSPAAARGSAAAWSTPSSPRAPGSSYSSSTPPRGRTCSPRTAIRFGSRSATRPSAPPTRPPSLARFPTSVSLDVLVCCAGVWDGSVSIADLPAEKLDEAFEELFALNVRSYLLAVKAGLDALTAARGSVILTLSNAAFHAGGGGPLYTASKFAVRGLVMQLASELAPEVAVNGVAPGGTLTPLRGLRSLDQQGMRLEDLPGVEDLIRTVTPLEVAPEPADHAAAYVYLADRAHAPAVTGSILRSDGGLDVRGLA